MLEIGKTPPNLILNKHKGSSQIDRDLKIVLVIRENKNRILFFRVMAVQPFFSSQPLNIKTTACRPDNFKLICISIFLFLSILAENKLDYGMISDYPSILFLSKDMGCCIMYVKGKKLKVCFTFNIVLITTIRCRIIINFHLK